MNTELGKIKFVTYGYGGYQDAQFGVQFVLSGKSWSVSDFWGCWSREPDDGDMWTYEQQTQEFAKTTRRIRDLLRAAKRSHLHELKGKPIEVTFESGVLKSWRILTEVI